MKRKVIAILAVLCIALLAACSHPSANIAETAQSTNTQTSEESSAAENTVCETESTAPHTEASTAVRQTKPVATAAPETTRRTEPTTAKKTEKPTVTTTKAYEYDMSNPAVKAVMAMVGEKHKCSEVAEAAVNQADLTGWKSHAEGNMTYYILEPEGFLDLGEKVSKSEIRPGDILYYADGGRGVSHVAVYVGNSQAVHGNWTTDGTTVLARAFYREPAYIIHIDYSK